MRNRNQAEAFVVPREVLSLGLLLFAFLFQAYVLFFPRKTFFSGYFLAIPDPFSRRPPLKTLALPFLLAAAACGLAIGTKKLPVLMKRPYRAVTGVFLLGVTLNFALIGSLSEGFVAFHKRALLAGHGEYLIEAVSIQDLTQTIQNYEEYVRGNPERIFAANKGPGVISFFYGIKLVAASALVRPVLEPLAPSAEVVRSCLAERNVMITAEQIENLRYLLALVFLLFPFLTYLPVFLIFWLGKTYADANLGALAALLYLFVPAISLLVAHLDFALFPFLVLAILAPFAQGVDQRRLGYVAVSSAVFTMYLTMTLSAVSLFAGLFSYLGIVVVQRLRRGENVRQASLEVGKVLGVFVLVCGTLLLALYAFLHFDPIDRYSYARAIQRNWTVSEYNMFWVNSNLLGYFLSFGLIYTVCVFIQQWRSGQRLFRGTADSIDYLTVSWLCLLAGLVAFGRQHGETNRLWTFLNPIGCLVTARLLYDSIACKRLWLPVFLFLSALILARYRLNYF